MIVVIFDLNGVVIIAIAINNNTPLSRNRTDKPQKVELVFVSQLGCPLENKNDRINRAYIQRVVQRYFAIGSAINHDLMPKNSSGFCVTLNNKAAPLVLKCVVK